MLLIVCRCMPSPRRRRRQQRRRLFRALIDISTCLVVSYELSLYVWYCVVLGTLHLYVLLLLLLLWWRSDARPWRFVGWLVDAFEEEQRDGYVVAISSYHLYPQTYYRVLGLLVLPPASHRVRCWGTDFNLPTAIAFDALAVLFLGQKSDAIRSVNGGAGGGGDDGQRFYQFGRIWDTPRVG